MEPSDQPNFKPHPYEWIVERLREEDSYLERQMFGCRACYFQGELKLVLADSGEEPWDGLLIATSKDRQKSLVADFSALAPHPILGKWLYLSSKHEEFEPISARVAALVLENDFRIGVVPSSRSKRKPR